MLHPVSPGISATLPSARPTSIRNSRWARRGRVAGGADRPVELGLPQAGAHRCREVPDHHALGVAQPLGGTLVGERAEAHPLARCASSAATGASVSATHRVPVALTARDRRRAPAAGRGRRPRRRGQRRTPRPRAGVRVRCHAPIQPTSGRRTRTVHDRREVGGRRSSPVRLSACPGPLGSGSWGNEEQSLSEDLEAREIAAEQTYVDEVYVQLDASTRNARALAAEGHSRGKLEHEGGLVERDAMVFQAAKRIAQLDAAHEGLVFGRLDLDPSIDAQPRYIGRIGVRNADRDVLLIDWRAPAAGVFYQATAATPSGVVRRRVLRSLHRTVIGVEDELLRPGGRDRPPDRRRGRADGAALPRPRPLDALHRRHHPGRAGPGDPRARQGRRVDLRRSRHRQDGRRPAPRRVPALLRPPALRGRRRARRRPQRRVHALHRARPAEPRRDRGRAALARRGRRRHPRHAPRRAGGRRRQGRDPDGRAAAPHRPPARAGSADELPDLLARRDPRARPRPARAAASPADVAGPPQPPAAAGGQDAARRHVAPGPGRARARARA